MVVPVHDIGFYLRTRHARVSDGGLSIASQAHTEIQKDEASQRPLETQR